MKIGDKITCISKIDKCGETSNWLEIGKNYIIEDISKQYKNLIKIRIQQYGLGGSHSIIYYDMSHFLSLSDERKKKLKKLNIYI